jgi:predicted RND superfamily exporter protein
MFQRLTDLWLSGVIRFPRLVLLGIVAIILLAALGLPRFKLDASADSLTLENDQDVNYFREISKNYSSGDFLIVTFTPHEDLFSDASLSLLRRLQDELAQIEGVSSVNSILNVPLLFSPKQSLREVAKDPRTLETPGVDRELAKREFLESPIYREMILGSDGQTTALQLNIAVDRRYIELVQHRDALRAKKSQEGLSAEEEAELARVSQEFLDYRTNSEARAHDRVEKVREVVARYKDGAQIFVGGVTMITADMISFIQKDLFIFGAATVLFIVLVLVFIFRSMRFTVIPVVTCLAAVFIMLGLLSWLDWRLTVISSNFVALLLILSMSIIVHLVVRYREYAEENPDWSQQQLISETIKFMAIPCLYTTLTTVVAFMSLVVSGIRPVIDFGWMMTIGLTLALALAFLLLPAGLMLLPRTKEKKSAAQVNRPESKPLTLYCSQIVERHGRAVITVSVLVGIFSIWGISRLQVENRFIDYFHETTEIYQGLSVIDQKLGGTTSLDIIINARAASGLVADSEETVRAFADEDDPFAEVEADPFADADIEEDDPFADAHSEAEPNNATSRWMTVAGLEQVEKIHDYLETLPEVGKVQSLAILYKVGKELNGSLNNFELAVMDKALSPEVRKTLVDPFLYGEEETRITMRVKDSYPGLKRAELVERIRQHLEKDLKLDVEELRFSGLLVLYNNMLQSLFSSQIVTLGVVFFCIMLMFVVLFRSVLVAFVGILPNVLAAISILGGMGLIGIPLDMMTITIAAITVGIGVDDTIHYIHRFKKEIAVDGDYVAAMHRSHGSIGKAMYYTSVIIIFGFSIMVLSEFIPTIYFGLLTGLAMFAALMGALFLLPKLILLVRPFKTTQISR